MSVREVFVEILKFKNRCWYVAVRFYENTDSFRDQLKLTEK